MISNIRDNRPSDSAFTIIELLMVILVMAILYGLSLTSIRAVSRHIRKASTRAELKCIETAWKQYYAHYQQWPTNGTAVMGPTMLTKELAEGLQGIEEKDSETINPDNIVFMEFARLNDDGEPQNAWGMSGQYSKSACSYYVAFDDDCDNRVTFPSSLSSTSGEKLSYKRSDWATDDDEGALSRYKEYDYQLNRGVIVWTFNPELPKDDPDYLIGSWQE